MNSGPNAFSIFSPEMEDFVQKEVRTVDLDPEERALINLTAQEVDAIRMIEQIPVGTELYRFKTEQYKELSATRAEVDKVVQEIRLQKMRRKLFNGRREYDRKIENECWIDEQRKFIIAKRMRSDLQAAQQQA
jgi:hypothetical protein